jgi:hypothetical protein
MHVHRLERALEQVTAQLERLQRSHSSLRRRVCKNEAAS